MATVASSIIPPNEEAIKAHLECIFAPCREVYGRGLIELRYGSPAPNQSAYFPVTPEGVEQAASFAAARNQEGANVYFGVNPRKPETRGAASDSDVPCAFWHFADLDDAEAVEMAGKRLRALPPTMTVTTGMEPHRRPHFYWRLEEPVGNMPEWTERQRGIAHALDGDAVINPSRIMRLAGTVNFPPQHKLQRGYKVELTSLRTQFSDERPPVTIEQVSTAYPVGQTSANIGNVQPAAGQNTLQAMVNGVRPRDYIARIMAGDNWHNNYRDLVAHWIDAGWTDAEIFLTAPAFTLAGFTLADTERAVRKYITSARQKFNVPEPDAAVVAPSVPVAFEATPWRCPDPAKIPPREWLFGDIMVRRFVSLLVAPPGAGKSLFTLEVAVSLALKMQLGPFVSHEQANVWVYNNEDPSDELDRRISGILIDKGIAPDSLAGKLFVDSGEHRELLVAKRDSKTGEVIQMPVVDQIIAEIKRNKIGLFIVDPFVETHTVGESNNDEINLVGRMYRRIAQEGGCAVWLVHHTRKTPAGAVGGAPGDSDAGRGASSLNGVARFSATLFPMSKEDAAATGIPEEDKHLFVRFDDAKANLKLKTDKAIWFKKETVDLGNATGLRPSDKVGVLAHAEMATRQEVKAKKERENWAVISTAMFAVFEGESMTLHNLAMRLQGAAEQVGIGSKRSVERFLEEALATPQRVGAWEFRLVNENRKGGNRWVDRRMMKGWE